MQESTKNPESYIQDDEIDIIKYLFSLYDGKWIIISCTFFASVIGVIVSLLLPNIYESKAMVVPVDSSNSLSGAMSTYGGLASLAGISLPASGSDSNSVKALKKLGSLSFFENNILPYINLPDLMALDYWDNETNTLIYDSRIYDEVANKWVRKYSYPNQQIPSAQESFIVFLEDHIRISEDKKNGFVNLTISHESPFIAKQWSEVVIEQINTYYRQKDKSEAQIAVNYLSNQIAMTNFSEIKKVIAELLQQQTQKLTLVEAKEFYVFDYIDPPAIMEEHTQPKRALICIIAFIIGGMLGVAIVSIRNFKSIKLSS